MIKFNFNQTGGYPLTTETGDRMQAAYSIFENVARMAGNFAIISGCEVSGTQILPGTVMINGELLEFRGGIVQPTVFIGKETRQEIFENGDVRTVETLRYCSFGTGAEQFVWANFKRVAPLVLMSERLASCEESIKAVGKSLDSLATLATGHIADKNNPHATTPAQMGILKVGGVYIGDIQGKQVGWSWGDSEKTITLLQRNANSSVGGDDLYRVAFGQPFAADFNFEVFTSFSYDGGYVQNNDIIATVTNKTASSFDVSLREVSPDTQNLYLNFAIFKRI